MKHLLLLIAFAVSCAAQTPPTSAMIVRRLTLVNQMMALGSPQSPVTLFTPGNDGFYRLSMYISGPHQDVDMCAVYTPGGDGLCAFSAPNNGKPSVVAVFALRAGQSVGYFTTVIDPLSGPYSIYIVVERLD